MPEKIVYATPGILCVRGTGGDKPMYSVHTNIYINVFTHDKLRVMKYDVMQFMMLKLTPAVLEENGS